MRIVQTFVPLVIAALGSVVGWAASSQPVFKIYVEHAGVYQVPFERLTEAGLAQPVATAGIGLRNLGQPVPVWVEDGGDGVFGPGDRLLFVGDVLRGDTSYLDPYSRFNCYVLDVEDEAPWHGETRPTDADSSLGSAALVARHHLEPDRVMVRFRTQPDQPEEEWYWERLSVADRKPFTQRLTVEELVRERIRGGPVSAFADSLSESLRSTDDAPEASTIRSQLDTVFGETPTESTSVSIRFGTRGWSRPMHAERADLPDHQIEVLINGTTVGTDSWDGTEHHVYELDVPSELFVDGDNELTLIVPKRAYPDSGDLLVDVVLLNWIELEYPRAARVSDEQLRLGLADPLAGRRVELAAEHRGAVDLYLSDGVRIRGERGVVAFELPDDADEFSVLSSDAAAAPNEVVLDRPSDLAAAHHQADYIMITHRSLSAGANRLAEFHRARGLTVEVVDVQDIYDDFNFGILSPDAIKDFLEHAHNHWRAPAPRFVLLVGDASWDFKNTTADDANYADWTYRPGENRRFWKNRSSAYAEGAELNHRNLVPTSSYLTLEGHAASDTWFVCFDDGDRLPDMAIGRIPVVDPDELERVIDKTIAFVTAPPMGPWRHRLLFIANESAAFQRRSDRIADEYARRGYVATKIYPHPSEPANEHHTRKIVEAMDEGVFAVHFIGHGGRYIWRTGPPDLAKNHDLFTLDHLDELADNDRLPVVLSLTCYSAPFDHPTADSIGEKLLRVPGRGAIAVFAASWRNSPSPIMGETMLAELTTPGNTIGEAVMRAKREFGSDVLIQTYNLLGDPAVPVAAPERDLELELEATDVGVRLRVAMPRAVGSGTLLVEWVSVDGATLRGDEIAVTGSEFDVSLDPGVITDIGQLAGARVYIWDAERRIDGVGWAELPPTEPTDAGEAVADGRVQDTGEPPVEHEIEIKGEL